MSRTNFFSTNGSRWIGGPGAMVVALSSVVVCVFGNYAQAQRYSDDQYQYDSDRDASRPSNRRADYNRSAQQHGSIGVQLDNNSENGVRISRVNPGSPAERAGLRQGDEIESIQGQQVSSAQDVIDSVQSNSPGKTLEVNIVRNGQRRTLRVTTNRAPARQFGQQDYDVPEDVAESTRQTARDIGDEVRNIARQARDTIDDLRQRRREAQRTDRFTDDEYNPSASTLDEPAAPPRARRRLLERRQQALQTATENSEARRGIRDNRRDFRTENRDTRLNDREEAYNNRQIGFLDRDTRTGRSATSERPSLGVSVEERDGYVHVSDVTDDSPAEEAGLRSGDYILSADDTRISNAGQLRRFLLRRQPGERVSLRIERDGRERDLDAKLGSHRDVWGEAESGSSDTARRGSQRL